MSSILNCVFEFSKSRLIALNLGMLCSLFSVQALAGDPISYQQLLALPQPVMVEPIFYGSDRSQYGELRLPVGDGPFPVIVFIHGGCWQAEYGIEHSRPFAQALADEGYAVWSLEYRRVGNAGGGWPGTFADIADGTDYLRQLSQTYPLKIDRLIAIGHSAGGQLALWLVTRSRLPQHHILYRSQALLPKAVIGLAAAADLSLLARGRECDDAARRLMHGTPEQRLEDYKLASPHWQVPLGVPQVLIDGSDDMTWAPISGSYFESALGAEDNIRRVLIEEAAHFDLIAPQGPVWPELKRVLSEMVLTLK